MLSGACELVDHNTFLAATCSEQIYDTIIIIQQFVVCKQ